MQLHQIKILNKRKRSGARVGRGGKRGTYSGRGQKGQKAHAGRRIKPAIYELISRLPKLRGYKNKPFQVKPLAVNVNYLSKIKGNTINIKTLREAGFVKDRSVKILGSGELKKAFTVELKLSGGQQLRISKEAQKKIEAAGGRVFENVE